MDISVLVRMLICAVVAALNTAAHWLPWQALRLADGQGRMKRLAAYSYGTGTILSGIVLGAVAETLVGATQVGVWPAVGFVGLVMAAAGVGTALPYALDALHAGQMAAADVRDLYEQTLDS